MSRFRACCSRFGGDACLKLLRNRPAFSVLVDPTTSQSVWIRAFFSRIASAWCVIPIAYTLFTLVALTRAALRIGPRPKPGSNVLVTKVTSAWEALLMAMALTVRGPLRDHLIVRMSKLTLVATSLPIPASSINGRKDSVRSLTTPAHMFHLIVSNRRGRRRTKSLDASGVSAFRIIIVRRRLCEARGRVNYDVIRLL